MSNDCDPSGTADSQKPEEIVVHINKLAFLRTCGAGTIVFVNYHPWHRFTTDDALDLRFVAANLVCSGVAEPSEVVAALKVSRATLHRDRLRLEEGGLPAMVAGTARGPKGPTKVTRNLRAEARKLRRQGLGKCEIARRVGLSEKTVRDIVKDVLLEKERPGRQGELLEGEVPVAPEAPEVLRAGTEGAGTPVAPEDGTPDEGPGAPRVESKAFEPTHPHHAAPTAGNLDRSVERVLARFGLIEEATVCFVPGQGLHFVGALLLLPALVDSGFFDAVEAAYGKLKNGFYGLRHTVMTLALMGALRLRRAEHLVHVPPEAIGRLLGLDRAPEVKTLRRRVAELGTLGGADRLMRRIGEDLARSEPEVLAFLYVDGHVRPYSGKRPIAQAYVTQRHLAMPATTDFWLHGADGQPLLVVTGEVVPALTKALLPILEAVRR